MGFFEFLEANESHFWEGDEWTYDPQTGLHYNMEEEWGFYDGDYGDSSDWSNGRVTGNPIDWDLI